MEDSFYLVPVFQWLSLFLEFFGAKEHSPDSTSVYYGDEIFKAFKAKHEKNRVTEKEES